MSDNVQRFDPGEMMKRITRNHAPGKKDPYGDAEGVVLRPDQLNKHNHASTVILCKDIADLLTKLYPGWAWAVQPDERGKVINIFNLNLHTEYGYTIRMMDIMNDPRRQAAIAGGSEILKRFRMPNAMDRARLSEAPRDMRGMCIPDISDFRSKKEKMNAEIAMGLANGTMEVVETPEGRFLKVNNG